jgi:hypothetical protein
VLRLNTHVAAVQSTATNTACTATNMRLTGLGGDGCVSTKSASVLIFETGRKRLPPILQRAG